MRRHTDTIIITMFDFLEQLRKKEDTALPIPVKLAMVSVFCHSHTPSTRSSVKPIQYPVIGKLTCAPL